MKEKSTCMKIEGSYKKAIVRKGTALKRIISRIKFPPVSIFIELTKTRTFLEPPNLYNWLSRIE